MPTTDLLQLGNYANFASGNIMNQVPRFPSANSGANANYSTGIQNPYPTPQLNTPQSNLPAIPGVGGIARPSAGVPDLQVGFENRLDDYNQSLMDDVLPVPNLYDSGEAYKGQEKLDKAGNVLGTIGKIGAAATALGAGTPLSLIGLAVSGAAGIGKFIQSGIANRRAKKSTPQQVTRQKDVAAPDLRVTGQERAAAKETINTGYATTLRQGALAGIDTTAQANVNRVNQELSASAQFSGVNRQAKQIEGQYDLQNQARRSGEDVRQDAADAQHAGVVQQVRTQAINAIPQTLLDLGGQAIGVGQQTQMTNYLLEQNLMNSLA